MGEFVIVVLELYLEVTEVKKCFPFVRSQRNVRKSGPKHVTNVRPFIFLLLPI
jgi:hypothetical protein